MAARSRPYPITTRRAVLKLFIEGVALTDIRKRFGVNRYTVYDWARQVGVKPGDEIGELELDRKLDAWANTHRQANEAEKILITEATKKQRATRENNIAGPQKNPLSLMENLKNPEQYKNALDEHFHRMSAQLDREPTIEGQVTAMTAGVLLAALRDGIDHLPPITTWTDMEKVIKLLRLTLSMDEKQGTVSNGPDIRVLNSMAKPRKVIEAEAV